MTDEELDAHLTKIRERRLEPIRIYEEQQALKLKLIEAKLIAKFDKQHKMFEKELAAADKAYSKLEARALKMKALALEIEEICGETERDSEDCEGGECSSIDPQSDAVCVRPEQTDGKASDGIVEGARPDGDSGERDDTRSVRHEEPERRAKEEARSEHREHGTRREAVVYKCGKCGLPVKDRFALCVRC